jgi:N-hydroxyarylamine O-acetyltransferase
VGAGNRHHLDAMDAESFALDAYLDRIGAGPDAGLAGVHRAHVTAIPFENLDPHRGVPVSLALGDLQRKLVDARRGGYCFEHNLLLAAGLRALGAEVEPMLARVRLGRPRDAPRPRTHLVLRVRADGAVWLADAGFGNGTLLEPIPFGPGAEHEQEGWRFRVVADGVEHVLQTADGAGWTDVYGFVPEPVPMIDIETSNWFTCTHPRSLFVAGLIIAVNRPDGARVALSDWNGLSLITRTPERSTPIEIDRAEIPRLLEETFGLPGFALGDNGRVTRPDAHLE